jgi:hypothetical protein
MLHEHDDLVRSSERRILILFKVLTYLTGLAIDWFEHKTSGIAGATDSSYKEQCQEVVERYLRRHVQCEYRFPKGELCELYKDTHRDKPHYNKKRALKPGNHYGRFETSFNIKDYAWHKSILEFLKLLEKDPRWDNHKKSGLNRAHAHQEIMLGFYKDLVAALYPHAICLCCLANPPTHHLLCGHIICTPCLIDFGISENTTSIRVDTCPLHEAVSSHLSVSPSASNPTLVRVQPQFSGLRVLCLDG